MSMAVEERVWLARAESGRRVGEKVRMWDERVGVKGMIWSRRWGLAEGLGALIGCGPAVSFRMDRGSLLGSEWKVYVSSCTRVKPC